MTALTSNELLAPRPPSQPLRAALWYGSRSWRVFPVARDKSPRVGKGGFHNATTDSEIIANHWTAHPDDNIALALRPSGLIAVDVDPRNGGDATFAALQAKYGPLPRECYANSGGGGRHFVMRDIAERRPRGKADHLGLGRGVDFKCNGYILVEPSVHSSGRPYAWARLDTDNAPAIPEAWVEILYHPIASDDAPEDLGVEQWATSTDGPLSADDSMALRAALKALGPRKSGNSTTFRAIRIACNDFGLSVEHAWPFLLEWNSSNGAPHSTSELERKLMDAAKEPADPTFGQRGHARKSLPPETRIVRAGVPELPPKIEAPMSNTSEPAANEATPTIQIGALILPEPPPPPDPGTWSHELVTALADVQSRLHNGARGAIEPEPLFEPAIDLLKRDYPDTPWDVRGLAKRRGTGLVAGAPKSGKSWALSEIAMAVATGTRAFGKFETSEPRRVAYFYAEDIGADVQAHLRALAVGRGLDPEHAVRNMFVQPRGRFLDVLKDEDLALIVASVHRLGGVDLLCIEPLRDIHSGEEDKSDAMSEVMRRLRLLGEILGCTVLAAHHNKKSETGDGGNDLRGSGAIYGSLDSGVFFSSPGGDGKQVVTVKVETKIKGARAAGKFGLTLTIDDDPQTDRARKAVWSVDTGSSDRDARDDAKEGVADDEMLAVLNALWVLTQKRERVTYKTFRKEAGLGAGPFKAAIERAVARKLMVREKTRGGWALTEAARRMVAGIETTILDALPPSPFGTFASNAPS